MALGKYRQTHSNSCGAVASMVSVAELGNDLTHISKSNEDAIYKEISFPKMSGYSWPGLIASELTGKHGRTVTVCEDRVLMNSFAYRDPKTPMGQAYQAHSKFLGLAKTSVENKIFGAHQFEKNARVMLVTLNSAGGLHYLLGRKDGGGVQILDPGQGKNFAANVTAFRTKEAFSLGGYKYRFTGIFLRIT